MEHGQLTQRRIAIIRDNPDKTVAELSQLTGLCDGNARTLIYKHHLPFRSSRYKYPFEKMDWRLRDADLKVIWRTKASTISGGRHKCKAPPSPLPSKLPPDYKLLCEQQQRVADEFLAANPKPVERGLLPPYRGQRKTMKEWSRALDIPCSTISNRLDKGWTMARVLSQKNFITGKPIRGKPSGGCQRRRGLITQQQPPD